METPLKVVFQDGDSGSARTGTFESNLITSAIFLISIPLSPVKRAVSDIAGDLGCCHGLTILRQKDVNGVGDIQRQEHGKVDGMQLLHAKLAISLLCT